MTSAPACTAALALCALAALAGCGAEPPAAGATVLPPASVSTATVARHAHGAVEVLPGTVKAATAATLMARVAGVVGTIAATPGERVAAGAVLVELDAQELAARRDQAKAAALQGAADFERARQLFDKQALTKGEFDAAQARASGSAAAAAEATILAGYTRITAPFAGMVVRKHVEVGDLLSPGRPVIDLEDPASLRLEVELPESLASLVGVGTRLRAQVGAAAFDAEAAVVEVTPAADPVSRTVLVKLALPPAQPGLRSGQFGRVTIPVAGGELLSVPNAAVVQRGQLDAVFVVVDGRARLRLVRLGGQDGGRTAIRAGLEPGEVVVSAGCAGLSDGQAVQVSP
jgi:RND family efflux transporter MFP subunit